MVIVSLTFIVGALYSQKVYALGLKIEVPGVIEVGANVGPTVEATVEVPLMETEAKVRETVKAEAVSPVVEVRTAPKPSESAKSDGVANNSPTQTTSVTPVAPVQDEVVAGSSSPSVSAQAEVVEPVVLTPVQFSSPFAPLIPSEEPVVEAPQVPPVNNNSMAFTGLYLLPMLLLAAGLLVLGSSSLRFKRLFF